MQLIYFFQTTGRRTIFVRGVASQPHTLAERHSSFLSVFHSRWDVTVSYQCSRLAGTRRYSTHTHTGMDGSANQPSRLQPSPRLCVLSQNSVTHTQLCSQWSVSASIFTGNIAAASTFYLIMHLHTLANKPSMLKSAMQTCAEGVKGACWQQGQKNVSVMALRRAHRQACVNDFATGRKKRRKI